MSQMLSRDEKVVIFQQINSNMSERTVKTFLLLCFFYILASSAFTDPGSPTIIQVSTSLDSFVAPTGSTQGGTIIYIKGTNFSPLADENKITVGPYPCILEADGAQENQLACRTTPATNPAQLYGLAVSVTVGSVFVSCNSNNCAYSYTSSRTPVIEQIIPRSTVGGGSVYIFGTHRITNLGDGRSTSGTDINNLIIGDRECTTTDIVQNQDAFSSSWRSSIECRADPTQVAGEYDFTEFVKPGYARKSLRTYQTSYFTEKNYTQRVLAQLTSLSSHQGGSKGQLLTVKGTGFSPNLTDYTCSVAGETCNVKQATLTELTVEVPVKSAGNTAFGALPQAAGDTSTQINGFLGGSGLRYKRYDREDMWKSTTQWLTYLRGAPTNNVVSEKILTELSSPEAYGENYIEHVKGYFYAPVDGTYRFSAVADDDFLMVFSSVKNNANPANLVPLLTQEHYSNNHYNPFVRTNVTQSSANLTLTQGYYYLQVLNANYGGSGFFKVLVDMPSLRQYTINPTWQIDRFIIKPSQFDAEIISVKVFAASGSFDLFYYNSLNQLQLANIPVGASAATFKDKLGNLPNINGYDPVVTLNTLDAAGNPTAVAGSIAGYEYLITINRYRPTTALPSTRSTALVAGSTAASLTVTRTSTHSPPLSGTFSILINNIALNIDGSVNLPFNIPEWKIENALNTLYQAKEIKANRVMGTQSENSIQFVIEYVGITAAANILTIDTTLLLGGKTGTSPQKTVEILRDYSNRELYSPVPYDFLYTASSTPALRISVKQLPAVCADCSYQFNVAATPVASSFSRVAQTVTLAVTDPAGLNFALTDLVVTFLGVPCSTLTGNIGSFTCVLPTNPDSSVALPAGTGAPKVHVAQIGFADNSGLTGQTIPVTVTSFSPAQTSPGGGIEATIVGAGFPISSSDGLTISVCGNSVVKFNSVTNKQVKFVVPPQVTACSGSNNQIALNGQTATFTFAYNPSIAPVVTSLSKTSSSPVLKSTITVSGSNFGTQASTKVFLVQEGAIKYQLSIISISSTSIQCILGGGKSGNYDVVVQENSNGGSTPDANSRFSYKIVITSLSITTGQKGGGYNLTVNGYNFAPTAGTNNVFIGDGKNSICSIVSSSATAIVCQVPRMLDQYSVDTPLGVVVTGRILEESVCEGTCTFTFVDAGASVIAVPTTTAYRAGDQVIVTGSGLTGATVTVNKIACVVNAVNDTVLNFTYPALAAGQYEVFINTASGWTYPQFMSSTALSIDSASVSDGSLYGMDFKVLANGLPAKEKILAWFVCSSTFALKVLTSTPTSVQIAIPPFTTDASCKVNVTVGQTFKLFNYNYKNTSTCSISVTGSGLSYTFTKNNMTTTYNPSRAELVWLDSAGNPTSSKYPLTISGSSLTATYLPAGTFSIRIHSTTHGYAYVNPSTVTVAFPADPTVTPITSSFVGGKNLVISGAGFVNNNPANNEITVCGLRANIVAATASDVTIAVPPLVSTTTQTLYSLADVGEISGVAFGDSALASNIADNSFNTLYSSTAATCYVGINFGANTVADVSEVRFVPDPNWAIAAVKLEGAIVQGSTDGSTYSTIFTVDTSDVHSGWNAWKKTTGTFQYQYVRFSHTSLSGCRLAEFRVIGIKYSTLPVTAGADKTCDVVVVTGNKVLSNAVTYSHAATSVVNSVTPQFGPSVGADVIHIVGTGFGSTVAVTIDGIDCPIVNKTSTEIYCTTGRRQSPPSSGNTFIVNSDGNAAKIASVPYRYIDRWSNTDTWGGEAVPREGDSVYVPKGMTLLVDQSTPILDAVIVEGKIQFEDRDLTFDTHYFVINAGQFEAGTETNRFQNKLTITLHGGYFDKQLPTLGNKVLGCRNCKFNMHGKQRTKTWTEVASTITPGAVTFSVTEAVDWVAGEKIAIAATGFDHYETEQKQISSVSVDGLTITVTTPFKYRHFSGTETYGSDNFVMRAEVGLLSRNIVVKGNDASVSEQYGSHLMLTGKQANGLVGKISYAEFTKCGQPKIVGRYCTHFHMAGEVPDSYIRGISVHHSYARVLTIHGTHFLLVEKSVGFHVKGHNIFVEDGIQTNNVIQDNLMMSSITSNTMLQSDITVASYWITNPYNTVRRNHAAGGDFYGFWYEIKEHPDGPSATSDICPMGMRLGISKDNVAHSNRRFGLRIFKLSARKYPCLSPQDESAEDPYIGNPPIQSVFENYTLWKNEECGFLGQELGYTVIRNFRTIDSRKGGMQFHKTNFTKEDVVAENCLVVGFSTGNAPADIDTDYNKARGVIASRTDGLLFNNIRFYNFGPTMTPLQSCSECYHFKLWVTGGKTTKFQNIQYTNIQGKYIFWEKWRREIFIDLDGTMSRPFQQAITPAIPSQSKAVISPFRPSLMVPGHCYRVTTGELWDNSVFCDQTITMRGILFTNGIPFIDFNAIDIKVNLMASATENVTLETEDQFSQEYMIIIKKSNDKKNSWAMPFATGFYYNVHWKWGVDFTHMAVAPSRLWDINDGIVLRFNYSDHRELFQIGKWYQQQLQLPFVVPSSSMIDPASCQNADYFHDQDNKYLYVCVSGRNKKIRQWIDLNGIRCINFCPTSDPIVERESFSRLWSNATQWPGGVLPTANQNVTIPYEWNLVLDMDPPIFKKVEINGVLIFDRTRDNTFQAYYIWVKQGIIRIGSEDSPFAKQATIILHGAKNDSYLVIDGDASGNKMLAVTGGLEFYGVQPQTAWTRLTATATIGATQISVASAAGWKVDDKIVIAPSYSGRKEFEEVTITAISGTTVTFTPALTFEHYGAASTTIENAYGVLDTRSAVGLLTRNIKITAAPDANNWGCQVLVYGYSQLSEDLSIPPVWKNGYAKLKGVEIDKCGQYDTTLAALSIRNIGSTSVPNNITTQVENSVIHGCGGFCTYIKQVSNVHINNNVFFYARKFLVYVEQVLSLYNFTNNFLVGARKRDELANITRDTMMVDDVAAYEQYVAIDFAADHKVNVSNNLAQGSEGEGFVFPSIPCNLIDSYPFINNTAGSCQVAFMYEKLDGQTCLAAKGCIGYASEIGLMANMPGSHQRVEYSRMFFADNQRGVTLRYAHEIDDNTLIFKDSYVTGISRPTCTNCYGASKISYCNGGYAVRMFTATITGQTFPLKKKATGHDVICTQQAYDFKAFLDGVTFENYLHTNPQLPYCSGMSVFKRHGGASDGTASHHLTNTRCINCETQSWAYFDQPSLGWRGWFGGCGELDCTGPNNYIIHDQDGLFTGERSQILSNNSMIGDYESFCQSVPQMNGHWCHTQELAVLEYESIAPDFNKRKMWPVYLKYEGGAWNSTTNGWKEWQWDGPEPMNLRLARFWSVIKLHENYNMTYASQPPSDSRFQIQKRLLPTGNVNDWTIVRIYYPLPNSIEVLVKNTTGTDILVKPYPIRSNVPVDLTTKTDICGANNFHFSNGTIEFVVNGKNNCQVRVRLSSFIQLSARIDIPIADFYSNNGITSFITNICAFLGIDTGRMKIVGVREGSTVIDSVIQTDPISLSASQTTPADPAADYAALNVLRQRLQTGLQGGSIPLGGSLLSFTANQYIFNPDGSAYTPEQAKAEEQSKTLIIVLAVVIPSVVIIAAIAGYCYWRRKRAQIHESDLVNNKSSVNREHIKGSTEFEISAIDEFAATTKYHNKKWADTEHMVAEQ